MTDDNLQSLLLRRALVNREQIAWAVESTRGTDCTWLEQLLLLGAIDEERLCRCVAHAACVPRCEPHRLAAIPPAALTCLPPEVAVEHRAVPLGLEPDGDLRVAMLDPTNSAAMEEIEFFAGRRLMREAALATAIAWALHQHYGSRSALWPRAARKPQALVIPDSPAEPVALRPSLRLPASGR